MPFWIKIVNLIKRKADTTFPLLHPLPSRGVTSYKTPSSSVSAFRPPPYSKPAIPPATRVYSFTAHRHCIPLPTQEDLAVMMLVLFAVDNVDIHVWLQPFTVHTSSGDRRSLDASVAGQLPDRYWFVWPETHPVCDSVSDGNAHCKVASRQHEVGSILSPSYRHLIAICCCLPGTTSRQQIQENITLIGTDCTGFQ